MMMPPAMPPLKCPIAVIDAPPRRAQRRRAARSGACQLAAGALNEYCTATTLHGLKYVGDSTLSVCERVYWLAAFAAGLCFAAYFIASIYDKYNSSPMVISFNPRLVLLNQIPFPAITICNVNLALRSKALEIRRNGDATRNALLDDFCDAQTGGARAAAMAPNVSEWSTVQAFIVDVNQKCDDMVRTCKWNAQAVDCNSIINSILTDEGYCCAFNLLPLNMTMRGDFDERGSYPPSIVNWNAEDGYGDADDATYPFRATGHGQSLGLTLALDAQLDEYYCTSTNSVGFKLVMSAPNERPKIAEVGFLLAPGGETRVSILPDVKDATDGVRNIRLEKRQCYFARERRLAYFNLYSEKSCRLECHANYSLEACQCVPYYLPRNPDDLICGPTQEECVRRAKSRIERFSPERSRCRCLPSCHDISYAPDTLSTGLVESKYDTVNSDLLRNVSATYFSQNIAIVHFYFEADKYGKQTKNDMYGFSEFLSNTGGLLGLFLGFSFLSAMEIVYFIFFRGPCRCYRRYAANKRRAALDPQKRWAHIPYNR